MVMGILRKAFDSGWRQGAGINFSPGVRTADIGAIEEDVKAVYIQSVNDTAAGENAPPSAQGKTDATMADSGQRFVSFGRDATVFIDQSAIDVHDQKFEWTFQVDSIKAV
jgi:hypothetical protein